MRTLSNLPPGCTDADIDRAAGGYDECFHEDYEANWEGRATCDRCGETWWLTAAQMRAERDASDSYDAYVRSEMRKERIASWFRPLAFWRRWRKPRPIDDEIPF